MGWIGPFVCFEFLTTAEIPGASYTYTYYSCWGGTQGNSGNSTLSYNTISFTGGDCAEVVNGDIVNGIGTAVITQVDCCEQPLMLSMIVNGPGNSYIWEGIDIGRTSPDPFDCDLMGDCSTIIPITITPNNFNGHVLEKDKQVEIEFVYDYDPFGTLEPSLIAWEANQGTLSSNYGSSVIWTQPDNYVSSAKDDVIIKARCGDGIWLEYKLTIAEVKVSSVSIEDNKVVCDLKPADLSGDLDVWVGDPNTPTIIRTVTNQTGGTNLNIGLDRDSIPEELYENIGISWKFDQLEIKAYKLRRFRALGLYINTGYNAPTEAQCTGSLQSVYMINGQNCSSFGGQLRSGFRFEVEENGSGHSINYGIIGNEGWCPYPTGGQWGFVFRANKPNLVGACNNNIVDDTTVAIRRQGHPYLNCGNVVYVSDVGTKTVNDVGGGLGIRHLDHFDSSYQACTGKTSVGDHHVFQLLP